MLAGADPDCNYRHWPRWAEVGRLVRKMVVVLEYGPAAGQDSLAGALRSPPAGCRLGCTSGYLAPAAAVSSLAVAGRMTAIAAASPPAVAAIDLVEA